MKLLLTICSMTWFLLAMTCAALSQDTSSQTPSTSTTGDQGAPPAATGPEPGTEPGENPPLSGLDAPSFEPGFGARSYLLPRLQVSEAVDTNTTGQVTSAAGKTVNAAPITGVTRGIGSLTLQKLWKIHPLDIDYAGGASYYQNLHKTFQNHSLGAIQRFLWRTGQLALRDSFTYLPTGNFGMNSFGGAGALSGGGGIGGLGGGGLSGGGIGGGNGIGNITNFGSTLNQPRIANMSLVDITQELSPRNSMTLAGGYGVQDFLNNPTGYVNSQQIVGNVGFNRKLNRQDQLAVTYSYQTINFPRQGSGFFHANAVQLLYGHRISGKLDLKVGGGPQWIHRFFVSVSTLPPPFPPIKVFTPVSDTILSGSAQATLTYHYSARTNLSIFYTHSTNAGSGLLTGANTDAIRMAASHQLTRRWNMVMDSGYSYNKRILSSSTQQAGNARSYRYWYAGGTLRRQISRHWGAFANYQYDAIGFASGVCTTNPSSCATAYGRHVGLIGIDWTPAPMRLD